MVVNLSSLPLNISAIPIFVANFIALRAISKSMRLETSRTSTALKVSLIGSIGLLFYDFLFWILYFPYIDGFLMWSIFVIPAIKLFYKVNWKPTFFIWFILLVINFVIVFAIGFAHQFYAWWEFYQTHLP